MWTVLLFLILFGCVMAPHTGYWYARKVGGPGSVESNRKWVAAYYLAAALIGTIFFVSMRILTNGASRTVYLLAGYALMSTAVLGLAMLLFGIILAIDCALKGLRAPYSGVPRCLSCGYNLTGNVSGVCPECGAPVSPPRGDDRPLTFPPVEPHQFRDGPDD